MLQASGHINHHAFDYFPALRKVRDYFEANYTQPISLKKAAAIAALEEKYFSRVFRLHVGVGFKEWTDLVRVERAIEKMSRQNQSLATVGFSVGFRSCATFQRRFKKLTQMRPRDFRNDVLRQLAQLRDVSA